MRIALFLTGLFCVVLVCGLTWIGRRFVPETEAFISGTNAADSERTGMSEPVQEVLLPDIAVQIVFVIDEEGNLDRCFYTRLNCLQGRMDFYMVPTDIRLQLSIQLYQDLVTKNAQLAQVNTLEGLYRSFPSDDAPECAARALSEAVGVSEDYYTVMPKQCCDVIIKENAHTYAYDGFLQENLQEQIIASGSMKAYLTALWEQCESNVSAASRLYYLETYEGLTNRNVSCKMVAGERHNNGYQPLGNGLQ